MIGNDFLMHPVFHLKLDDLNSKDALEKVSYGIMLFKLVICLIVDIALILQPILLLIMYQIKFKL